MFNVTYFDEVIVVGFGFSFGYMLKIFTLFLDWFELPLEGDDFDQCLNSHNICLMDYLYQQDVQI